MSNNSGEIEKKQKRDGLEGSNMSFGDHLMELRQRIIKSLLGIVVGFLISMVFCWEIIEFLAAPLVAALELNGFSSDLLATGIATPFMTYMKVACISGIFLTSPWIFYQVWGFVAAGLYSHEKRYVNTFVPFAAILFVLGGLFFVTVVAPISMNFFLNFNKGLQIDPEPSSWHKMLMGKLEKDDDMQKEEGVETPPEPEVISNNTESEHSNTMKVEWVFPLVVIDDHVKLSFEFPYNVEALNDTVVNDTAVNDTAVNDTSEKESEVVAEKTEEQQILVQEPHLSTIDVKCTINEYIHFVTILSLAFGISFQMPLAVFLLGRLNLVSLDTLKKVRKYVILGIVVFSAFITPPDVISQILMSIPMYFLYELGILMVRFWPRKSLE